MKKVTAVATVTLVLLVAPSVMAQTILSSYSAWSVFGNQSPPPYGLRLDGFYDFGNTDREAMFDIDGSRFDVYDNGTANLHGVVTLVEYDGSNAALGLEYEMSVWLNSTSGPGSYDYYVIDGSQGTELISISNPGGDHSELVSKFNGSGVAFQVGDGANGKNSNYGASAWVNYEHWYQNATHGSLGSHVSYSDFLMDLTVIPEPGTLALLGFGLAGSAGFLRRRKNVKS